MAGQASAPLTAIASMLRNHHAWYISIDYDPSRDAHEGPYAITLQSKSNTGPVRSVTDYVGEDVMQDDLLFSRHIGDLLQRTKL